MRGHRTDGMNADEVRQLRPHSIPLSSTGSFRDLSNINTSSRVREEGKNANERTRLYPKSLPRSTYRESESVMSPPDLRERTPKQNTFTQNASLCNQLEKKIGFGKLLSAMNSA